MSGSGSKLHDRGHLVLIIVKPKRVSIPKPVFEWERDLAEVLLSKHAVLVPDNDLDRTKPIGEGEINGKIERSIFQTVLWVCIALDDRGMVPRIQ